ncbi:SepM family pheromone-processing serine protease [Enterococcus faecalis]|uniref:SepM family pheromone-processing serine protease n=1 Tax=Enterococcus TaxID=1350 RepID=UPI0015748C4E|nr:SepM family pheromone-processing serine protease [Enterococcus faecalis]ELS0476163.1 PDZ domain-containing protein [Enterococcus faecalis]MDB1105912.1 SepM family pheromone-processing serine protease [Enterococcus faecalis]MDT2158596.1 SepM family pheromone-processing serine protease [Enterococcus faecalis]NST16181.1 PDZ domain-containing protein [Enterococcus faecalis]NSU79660.1 PDZ domain-containing protein [Enterococcus faecalis]
MTGAKIMNKKTEKFSFKSLIPMVLALLLIGLFIVPIPYYIEGPGTTENLKEFVTVDGKKDTQSGAFYLTTVGIRSATIFSAIKANFSDFQEVMSKKELMGDSSNSEYNRIQQYYMDSSKNAAIEQALKLAKVPYEMKFKGVYVLAMEDNSSFKGKIEVGDTVTGVDGKSFKSSEELMNYIKAQKVNQKVTVQFIQDGKAKEATGKLIELPTDKKAGIGIGLTDHTEIDSSIQVSIEAGDIGGPSAGLMFTLQTYEQLSHKDLRKGHEIAGTGTMNSQGIVGRIGGIDKKVVTASENGAEIFFAPDDEITSEMKKVEPKIKSNYQEAQEAAKKIGTKMKIVPVKTVQDALNYLEKLK